MNPLTPPSGLDALRELAVRIDNDGTASQIGSADEIREIIAALTSAPETVEAVEYRYRPSAADEWDHCTAPNNYEAAADMKARGYQVEALYASPPPAQPAVTRFTPVYNGIEDGFGTVAMVESEKGEWVKLSAIDGSFDRAVVPREICEKFIADPCGSSKCASCGKRRAEHPRSLTSTPRPSK